MNRQWRLGRMGVILAAIVVPFVVQAQVNTWNGGGGDSNWVTAANWDQGHAPTAGEIAVISVNNAKVNLYTDTADLGGLLVTNGATLSVYSPATNGSTAWGLLVSVSGTVTIAGNAWINPYSQNTNGGSAWFRCLDLVIGPNSGFNANEKGYRGGNASIYNSPGYGPGTAPEVPNIANGGGGAGYGGKGGMGNDGGRLGGSVYGDYTNPTDPGSGSPGVQWAPGYPGGGLVYVEAANSVLVDGSILANGANGASYMGGGSGGGINIKCNTFKGSGLLAAVGGNSMRNDWRDGGSGGGGRIAVIFDPTAQAALPSQPTATFNSAGGYKGVSDPSLARVRAAMGRPGSLYFTTNTFFDLARIQGGAIMVPGVTSWAMNNLALSNGVVSFPSGFNLTVTQDVTITAGGGIDMSNSVASIGRDLIVNSDYIRGSAAFRGGSGQGISVGRNVSLSYGWLDIYGQGTTNYFSFPVGGNLSVTNLSASYLYSGMTNGTASYGMLVDVAGNMTIATNCWVYPYSHYTNGGSVHFKAANLTVNGGGGIDASAKGFSGAFLSTYSPGYGPGRGPGGNSASTAGAGYGGQGGSNVSSSAGGGGVAGGVTYGDSNAPVHPGSGGGSSQNLIVGGGMGRYGGGLIFVEAGDTVVVDGSFLADGESANGYGGSGSGGAIYVYCKKMEGASGGKLSAKGGTNLGGQGTWGSAGGGGGRIAVWYKSTNNWFGVAQADGGLGRYAGVGQEGAAGTVVWKLIPGMSGTLILVE